MELPGGRSHPCPVPLRGWGKHWKHQHTYLQVKSGNTLKCDGLALRNLPMGVVEVREYLDIAISIELHPIKKYRKVIGRMGWRLY